MHRWGDQLGCGERGARCLEPLNLAGALAPRTTLTVTESARCQLRLVRAFAVASRGKDDVHGRPVVPKVLKESSRFLLVEARATRLGQGIPDWGRVDDEPRTGARYLGHWTRKTERRGQCVEMRVECWSDAAGRRVVGGGETKGPRSSGSNSSSRFAVG